VLADRHSRIRGTLGEGSSLSNLKSHLALPSEGHASRGRCWQTGTARSAAPWARVHRSQISKATLPCHRRVTLQGGGAGGPAQPDPRHPGRGSIALRYQKQPHPAMRGSMLQEGRCWRTGTAGSAAPWARVHRSQISKTTLPCHGRVTPSRGRCWRTTAHSNICPLPGQWIAAYMMPSWVASLPANSTTTLPCLATRMRSDKAITSGKYDEITTTAFPASANRLISA
jgi:hypothetical protein